MMFLNSNNNASTISVRVGRLIFLEQPGFVNKDFRPLSVSLDKRKFDRLQEASQNGRNFTAQAFERVAPEILMPSARSEGTAVIPDGWSSARLSFMLEVSLINQFSMVEQHAVINGYTDHYGVATVNGKPAFDPNMRLYFNNITKLAIATVQTPAGNIQRVNTIGSEQVMRPTIAPQPSTPGHAEFAMRPTDVMLVSGSSEMMAQAGVYVENYLATFHDGVKLANRADMQPANYLSNTVTKYARASQEIGEDVYDAVGIAEKASQLLNTNRMIDSDLIVLLQNRLAFNDIAGQCGSVSYHELCTLDPNADNVAQMMNLRPQLRANRQAMLQDSCGWSGANNETIAATMISQVLPSLAFQYSLGRMRFNITNDTVNGMVAFSWEDLKGFSTQMDVSAKAPALQDAIISTIFNPVSVYGQMVVSMKVELDVTSRMDILISLNHGPLLSFDSACCADQLTSPFVTRSYENVATMSSDLANIASEMAELQYTPTASGHQGGYNAFAGV